MHSASLVDIGRLSFACVFHARQALPRIGPSRHRGRTGLWIGAVLQRSGFMQVRIHKLCIACKQARSDS